ncbi:MAG TPA: SprT family zinc-dependent metalloprotease [Solirubrobacteraceae bacterium]|nr:SprT family zinc-dependent metalloprotease [Solirubrobacteraceae bacterium]
MRSESPLRAAEGGLAYRVRRSARARRVRVTVRSDGEVEVVLPARAAERAAAAAVRELRPWIDRRLVEVARSRAAVRARGDTVPFLGRTLAVVEEPGRTRVHRRGDALHVPAGADRAPALERWYRRAAQEEVSRRLDRACAQVGRSYERLSIRGQSTRWASCSRSGTMSFNWRLLLAPEAVLDYVIWHEVCHLDVMDHSPRFWALLESRCPGYREQVRWLRRHGATLVLD